MTGPDPAPTSIPIRPAVPPDAAEVARVHVASWRAAYVGIVPAAQMLDFDGTPVEEVRYRLDLGGR